MDVKGRTTHPVMWLLVGVLFCVSGFSTAYLVRERRQSKELAASRDQLSAALSGERSQIQDLSRKLDAMAAAREAPAAPVRAATPPPARHARRATARKPADDPRYKLLQAQISEQRKQLAATQEQVQKASQEWQGQLSSTRDELSGSIARTHEDVVALQKRGERNYYEFQLAKSKEFQRVGPLSLALRKADAKHKHFNLAMFVDDARLEKKNVNLYEPIWVNLTDRPAPVELVVNKITKDGVEGYLSEPKYKKSELAQGGQPAAPVPAPAQPGFAQR